MQKEISTGPNQYVQVYQRNFFLGGGEGGAILWAADCDVNSGEPSLFVRPALHNTEIQPYENWVLSW